MRETDADEVHAMHTGFATPGTPKIPSMPPHDAHACTTQRSLQRQRRSYTSEDVPCARRATRGSTIRGGGVSEYRSNRRNTPYPPPPPPSTSTVLQQGSASDGKMKEPYIDGRLPPTKAHPLHLPKSDASARFSPFHGLRMKGICRANTSRLELNWKRKRGIRGGVVGVSIAPPRHTLSAATTRVSEGGHEQ